MSISETVSSNSGNGLPKFQGRVVVRGEGDYAECNYQYATTSRIEQNDMNPSWILYPRNVEDIQLAVEYARKNGLSIAVRTGGHQYSGASSTTGDNFTIDLSDAFQEFEHDPSTDQVRLGVSQALFEVSEKLGDRGLFVPHGMCGHVHVGGHATTGGYGQLTRAYGLFADHILELEIITADGEQRKIRRDSNSPDDKDLFFAILGGSPGNIGIITHFTIETHRDDEHPHSRGMKLIYFYSSRRLRRLLNLLVELADDEDLPADYDFSVTVMSESNLSQAGFAGTPDKDAIDDRPDFFGFDGLKWWPSIIVIYAQFSDLDGTGNSYDPKWFKRIKRAAEGRFPDLHLTRFNHDKVTSISAMSQAWVFRNVREFNRPYLKRAYATDSRSLRKDGWVDDVVDQIGEVIVPGDGIDICAQFFHWGGKQSKLRSNGRDGRTAYSWRDHSICCIVDLFYTTHPLRFGRPKKKAEIWQKENDELFIGEKGSFCVSDRRYLWGSHGSKDLPKVWDRYFDSEEKWNRLCDVKASFDPDGIFTPNRFCVGNHDGGQDNRFDDRFEIDDQAMAEQQLKRHMESRK